MVSIFSTRAIKIGQNISLNDKGVQNLVAQKLCLNLAKQVVVGGEGAKIVTINVINAAEVQILHFQCESPLLNRHCW